MKIGLLLLKIRKNFKNIFPVLVIIFLVIGFLLGILYPQNEIVKNLYSFGTYFPKFIVTCSAFLIFNLLTATIVKMITTYKEKADRFFFLVFSIYIWMGFFSLIYVVLWIVLLQGDHQIVNSFFNPVDSLLRFRQIFMGILTKQPLLQALLGAIILGYFIAKLIVLKPIANGFLVVSDYILIILKKITWCYPVFVGCLAIGIPMKFGVEGMENYAHTVLQVAAVSISWSMIMFVIAKMVTKRSSRQLLEYYASVWPTGFGTGGSYDTLAVNLVSAEKILGLRSEIAEISILLGTVLNKNGSTMSVFLVTVAVCSLLNIPISLTELILLIPPVLILGLESPGIPGGAGVFMSPIIGALMGVTDLNFFVTTFVTIFSGLIPMLSTACNTTDDGIVGAILQDCFKVAKDK